VRKGSSWREQEAMNQGIAATPPPKPHHRHNLTTSKNKSVADLEPPHLTPPEHQPITTKTTQTVAFRPLPAPTRSGVDLGRNRTGRENQDKTKGAATKRKTNGAPQGGGRWCGDDVSSHYYCWNTTW